MQEALFLQHLDLYFGVIAAFEAPDRAQQTNQSLTSMRGGNPWSPAEENELLILATDQHFRMAKLGTPELAWPEIAAFFSRSIDSVREKYSQLVSSGVISPQCETRSATVDASMPSGEGAQRVSMRQHLRRQKELAEAAEEQNKRRRLLFQNYVEAGDNRVFNRDLPGLPSGENVQYVETARYNQEKDSFRRVREILDMNPSQKYIVAALIYNMNVENMTEEQVIVAAANTYSPEAIEQAVEQYLEVYSQSLPESAAFVNGNSVENDSLQHQPGWHYTHPPMNEENLQHGMSKTKKKDKMFWDPEEQKQLVRLVEDANYRRSVIGIEVLDWQVIANYLGRGKRSAQRKYYNIRDANGGSEGTANISLPENDGKRWSPAEVQELIKLVEDKDYCMRKLGIDHADWKVLGKHFGRSHESVSYKYSYIKNREKCSDRYSKPMRAKDRVSYKVMAVEALRTLGGQGTSSQICDVIADIPKFEQHLDKRIVSGKRTLQKWKHGVRSALNAFDLFNKTDRVSNGEAVWELDLDAYNKFKDKIHEKIRSMQSTIDATDAIIMKENVFDGSLSNQETRDMPGRLLSRRDQDLGRMHEAGVPYLEHVPHRVDINSTVNEGNLDRGFASNASPYAFHQGMARQLFEQDPQVGMEQASMTSEQAALLQRQLDLEQMVHSYESSHVGYPGMQSMQHSANNVGHRLENHAGHSTLLFPSEGGPEQPAVYNHTGMGISQPYVDSEIQYNPSMYVQDANYQHSLLRSQVQGQRNPALPLPQDGSAQDQAVALAFAEQYRYANEGALHPDVTSLVGSTAPVPGGYGGLQQQYGQYIQYQPIVRTDR